MKKNSKPDIGRIRISLAVAFLRCVWQLFLMAFLFFLSPLSNVKINVKKLRSLYAPFFLSISHNEYVTHPFSSNYFKEVRGNLYLIDFRRRSVLNEKILCTP